MAVPHARTAQQAGPSLRCSAANRSAGRAARGPAPPASFLRSLWPARQQPKAPGALEDLLAAVDGAERGLATPKAALPAVEKAVEALRVLGQTTTGPALSATWALHWTTERETLWILRNARLFGTQAGDVFQVIDAEAGQLQNVITFPPEGAFIVDSGISVAGPQRVEFRFTAATLKLPARALRLPPFGQGWFDNLYVDDRWRVAKDVRGDVLVCARDGPPREFR